MSTTEVLLYVNYLSLGTLKKKKLTKIYKAINNYKHIVVLNS